MLSASDAKRRWLGLFSLAVAFGMLVWGQTVLKPHLTGAAFLFYWLACFLFTIGSIVIALLDVRATRRRTREEQGDLIRRTLEEVDAEQARREAAGGGCGTEAGKISRRGDTIKE